MKPPGSNWPPEYTCEFKKSYHWLENAKKLQPWSLQSIALKGLRQLACRVTSKVLTRAGQGLQSLDSPPHPTPHSPWVSGSDLSSALAHITVTGSFWALNTWLILNWSLGLTQASPKGTFFHLRKFYSFGFTSMTAHSEVATFSTKFLISWELGHVPLSFPLPKHPGSVWPIRKKHIHWMDDPQIPKVQPNKTARSYDMWVTLAVSWQCTWLWPSKPPLKLALFCPQCRDETLQG